MNDKQKEIALELAVENARYAFIGAGSQDRRRELLAAFDAAADAPKRKPTTADIKVEDDEGFRRVWCGEFGWTDRGWERRVSHTYSPLMAEVIRAGLVATGSVPEVGE